MGSQPFRTEILRVCSPPSFIGIELKIGGGALVMSLRATLLGLLERDIWNSQISKQAAADMFASTRRGPADNSLVLAPGNFFKIVQISVLATGVHGSGLEAGRYAPLNLPHGGLDGLVQMGHAESGPIIYVIALRWICVIFIV
jgi:hypothetical protein